MFFFQLIKSSQASNYETWEIRSFQIGLNSNFYFCKVRKKVLAKLDFSMSAACKARACRGFHENKFSKMQASIFETLHQTKAYFNSRLHKEMANLSDSSWLGNNTWSKYYLNVYTSPWVKSWSLRREVIYVFGYQETIVQCNQSMKPACS